MKTKAHFYIRGKFLDEIGAVARRGYLERIGQRVYAYYKSSTYWFISDYATGFVITYFKTLKECQEYLQKVSIILEKRLELAEEEPDNVKFTRAVIEQMRKEVGR